MLSISRAARNSRHRKSATNRRPRTAIWAFSSKSGRPALRSNRPAFASGTECAPYATSRRASRNSRLPRRVPIPVPSPGPRPCVADAVPPRDDGLDSIGLTRVQRVVGDRTRDGRKGHAHSPARFGQPGSPANPYRSPVRSASAQRNKGQYRRWGSRSAQARANSAAEPEITLAGPAWRKATCSRSHGATGGVIRYTAGAKRDQRPDRQR